MAELYCNASIDHDTSSAIWRANGQLVQDLGATGVRFDSHMAFRFDDPADAGTVEPFFQANVDRAAELGLKMSIIVAPIGLRSAAWDALGGDWDGFVPNSIDWRATRFPNHPAVNAKLLEWVLTNVGYAVQELGEDRVEVEFGNEPRHVYRSGGDPNTTLENPAAASTTLDVVNTAGFDVLLERSAGYVVVETNPRQYAIVNDFDSEALYVDRAITANAGTVVRVADSYDNDGQVDTDWLEQLSGMIVGFKAAYPNVRSYLFSLFQLGQANVVGGISTYLDFLEGLDPEDYPGFELVDGFCTNIYMFNPAPGNLSAEHHARLFNTLSNAVYKEMRSRTCFGIDTKPLVVTEFGSTMADLGMTATGVPQTERQRGRCVRRIIDSMTGSSFDRVSFYAANDAGGAGIKTSEYGFVDSGGNVSSGLVELARGRAVSATVVPSGYTNAGGAYVTAPTGAR